MGILNGPELLGLNLELMTLCPKESVDCHMPPCPSVASHVNIPTGSASSLFAPSENTNRWHCGTGSLLHFYKICISETQCDIHVMVSKEIILLSAMNHRNIIYFFRNCIHSANYHICGVTIFAIVYRSHKKYLPPAPRIFFPQLK